MQQNNTTKLTLSALLVALGFILPIASGQIPGIGRMLLPMHLPVLLAGFLVGPAYAAVIGFLTPLLRSAVFGMPPFFPTAVTMAFELGCYGAVTGLLFRAFRRLPFLFRVYISLLIAMIAGRIVSGIVRAVLTILFLHPQGLTVRGFLATFVSSTVLSGIPGIVLQLILIPMILLALKSAGFLPLARTEVKPTA